MWWWATYYARPATDEEATAQSRERLSLMLDGLAGLNVPVEGDLGGPDPLAAIGMACAGPGSPGHAGGRAGLAAACDTAGRIGVAL